jgi:Flp pilus assembly pilin Flp
LYLSANLITLQRGVQQTSITSRFSISNPGNKLCQTQLTVTLEVKEAEPIVLEEDEDGTITVSFGLLVSLLVVGSVTIVVALSTIVYFVWKYHFAYRGHQLLA